LFSLHLNLAFGSDENSTVTVPPAATLTSIVT